LAVALAARYGAQAGREAAVDALAWAWEHWDRVAGMGNALGYVYRVGQTRARRRARPFPWSSPMAAEGGPDLGPDPALAGALAALTARQRQVVVLAHGYGFTHREVADLLGLSRSSVQNHAERGLAKLRDHMEANR
jgi:DNA-directed RNA polymerase specialized sigma24 family protein